MTTILIVCGAGASSTFLASRLRALTKTRGLDLSFEAASDSDVAARLLHTDLLLIGPHLAERFDSLRAAAAENGATAVLLPENVFGPTGAELALDQALSALASRPGSPTPTEGVPRG